MSVEQDFVLLIKRRAKQTNIYVVADTKSRDRIPQRAEQFASYVVSEGKLTVKHDTYDAITQPEIFEAVMQVAARLEGRKNGEIRSVFNEALSDYMDVQVEQ